MTNTNTEAGYAAAATDSAAVVNAPKPSRKRLRAPSGAHEKPAKASPAPVINEKADNTGSSNASAAGDASNTLSEQPRQTKASIVEALLTREGGASLEALCKATGWQAHTCRAFLTGLRKKGRQVIRASDKDGKSIYLIAPDRSPGPLPGSEQAEAESA